jgi:hypothetical protein
VKSPDVCHVALVHGAYLRSRGAIAAWSITRDLVIGVAGNDLYRFDQDENPFGFCALVAGKGFSFFTASVKFFTPSALRTIRFLC